jgi:hypothetical protein
MGPGTQATPVPLLTNADWANISYALASHQIDAFVGRLPTLEYFKCAARNYYLHQYLHNLCLPVGFLLHPARN